LPDYFSNRFYDEKKILMNMAALFILIFFVVYTSSGFVACGKLFESLFGFNYQVSMIASAFIIVIYTAIGGFMAESTVDFVQGILMILALTFIITIGVVVAGGIPQILTSTGANSGYLSMFSSSTVDATQSSSFGIIKILSGLAWGLGYVGMPHILLRFMAIRDAKELKQARTIGTTWCVISLSMAVVIGIVGKALYPTLLTGKATENIFIVMCKTLLDKGFLPIIGGVMLCGILAAQISTSDSQLLLASASVSQNFYKGFLKPNATEKQVMWMARLTIIGVAICAAIMALNPDSSIFEIVSFAWAGFGACFGPLVVFSLYWKRMNLQGAIAGMITGGVAVFIWKILLSPLGGVFSLYELLPAFIASSIAIVGVSLLTKEPSKVIQDEFDKTRALAKAHK
jgi:sodium/proline symporter